MAHCAIGVKRYQGYKGYCVAGAVVAIHSPTDVHFVANTPEGARG